ncbi:MAG TPA: ABC transporter permease [Acidimicrobiales bacterium]|nr:ABC transporter permease [Acidimicrobiales bacterium]
MSSSRRLLYAVAAPVIALVVTLAITSIVILISGANPLDAYRNMIEYSTRLRGVASIVNQAVPLFIAGVAVAIGFQMNLFNIGVEGQYRLAGLIAAWAGAQVAWPAVFHVTFIIAVAMIVGALWAGIAGVLKVTRNVNEVISTIMLNQIAFGVGLWLFNDYLKLEGGTNLAAQTEEIPSTGWMPSADWLFEIFGLDMPGGRSAIYGFLIVAIALGALYWVTLMRTRFGYDLRASGLNPNAALTSGVNPKRMVIVTMLLSGAVAGLIGLPSLMGNTHFYDEAFPAGLGFDGIAVALLGQYHPVGMAVGALLFGFLDYSSGGLQLAGIEPEVVAIMKGTIMLCAVIAYTVVRRLAAAAEVQEAARRLEHDRPGRPSRAAPAGAPA